MHKFKCKNYMEMWSNVGLPWNYGNIGRIFFFFLCVYVENVVTIIQTGMRWLI